MSSSGSNTKECDGIFDTCLSTPAMAAVVGAIIIAGALVMSIPFIHCTIKNRRRERENAARAEVIENIQLQVRNAGPPTQGGDNVRDFAPAQTEANDQAYMSGAVDGGETVKPAGPVLSKSYPAPGGPDTDPDAILPADPLPFPPSMNPLRQNPVELEKGLPAAQDFAPAK